MVEPISFNNTYYLNKADNNTQTDGRIMFEYDNDGNLTGETIDINRDNTPEQTAIWEHSEGKHIREVKYYDAGGNVKSMASYTYDDNGNMLEYIKKDLDGNSVFKQNWEYNDAGNVTKMTKDNGANGAEVDTIEYKYDDSGRISEYTRDTDGDGKADNKVEYSYDEKGNVTKNYTENPVEEAPAEDSPVVSENDDSDVNNSEENYFNDDGLHFEYYDNGHEKRVETDKNGDGKVDYAVEYDEKSRRTKLERDENQDGKIDYTATYKYSNDGTMFTNVAADGAQIIYKTSSGQTEYRELYEDGKIKSLKVDRDSDKNVDFIQEFDRNGNCTNTYLDNDDNGTIDVIYTDTFDENGNPIKRDIEKISQPDSSTGAEESAKGAKRIEQEIN